MLGLLRANKLQEFQKALHPEARELPIESWTKVQEVFEQIPSDSALSQRRLLVIENSSAGRSAVTCKLSSSTSMTTVPTYVGKIGVAFFDIEAPPIGWLAHTWMRYEGGQWQVTNVGLWAHTYRKLYARDYLRRGRERLAQGEALTAFYSLRLAETLAQVSPNTVTDVGQEVSKNLKNLLQSAAFEPYRAPSWSVGDRVFNVKKLGIRQASRDIVPFVEYQSRTDRGDQTVEEEARVLLRFIKNDNASLLEEFTKIAFTAHRNRPGENEDVSEPVTIFLSSDTDLDQTDEN